MEAKQNCLKQPHMYTRPLNRVIVGTTKQYKITYTAQKPASDDDGAVLVRSKQAFISTQMLSKSC